MSFLSRYWQQVERQVSETGMNPGDVVVDLNQLLNNTEVTDTVEPQPEVVVTEAEPQTRRPIVDEPMPQYAVDPDAWETRARRSARPGKKSQRMEDADEKETRGRHRHDGVKSGRTRRSRKKNKTEKGEDLHVD